MSLTVEILGSNATAPTAHGPASGYLLDTPTGAVLVDAGPGVMAEYVSRHDLERLRGIVVTHLHADHSLDLMALAYRWTFPERLPRIPLFVPGADAARLRAFDAVFGIGTLPGMDTPIHSAWEIRALRLGGEEEPGLEALGLRLRSFRAHHPVPAASLRFEYQPDGNAEPVTVAFSGDTGRCEGVVEAAREADLFVCEATYLEADRQAIEGHGHLTGRLAGQLAEDAAVRHLVLSHFSTDEMRGVVAGHAAERFSGRISVASRGAVY